MATYTTRATGIKDEAEVLAVVPELGAVPEGWNMTAEQAAARSWYVGHISRDGRRYRAVCFAQQTFRKSQWRQNLGGAFDTFGEAMAWIVSSTNNVLETL